MLKIVHFPFLIAFLPYNDSSGSGCLVFFFVGVNAIAYSLFQVKQIIAAKLLSLPAGGSFSSSADSKGRGVNTRKGGSEEASKFS